MSESVIYNLNLKYKLSIQNKINENSKNNDKKPIKRSYNKLFIIIHDILIKYNYSKKHMINLCDDVVNISQDIKKCNSINLINKVAFFPLNIEYCQMAQKILDTLVFKLESNILVMEFKQIYNNPKYKDYLQVSFYKQMGNFTHNRFARDFKKWLK